MTLAQNEIEQLARKIAEQEIGGPPPRCTGHKADRYNAAFNAVVKAASAERLEALLEGLLVARRAIVKAAEDTLWCDDSPAETVVDRIDALLAEGEGQQRLPLSAMQSLGFVEDVTYG